MNMLKMCLNWKVIAGLAAVGVGIYAIAPDMALAALPILLIAICPISMMFMMKGMQGGQGEGDAQQASDETDGDVTREEKISRLRAQQDGLGDKIAELEQDEPRRAANRGET